MSILRKSLVLVLVVLFCSVSIVIAGDQIRDRDPIRDRLKDGSCQDFTDGNIGSLYAADRTRDRIRSQDRLRDGSCKG